MGAMFLRRTLLACLPWVFVVLFTGCSKENRPPTGPTPNGDTVIYSALGASDAIGYGSTNVCGLFDGDCPNGTGYIYLLKRRLQAAGKTVTLFNRGVPGFVLSPAMQALARQLGRDDVLGNFIDGEVPFIASESTHVTVFTGGNDANAIAQAVRAGLAGNDIRGFIDRQVQQWGTDFVELIRRIRTRAPNARVVAYNVPNLAALPYVARNSTEERSLLQRIAVGLADRINAAVSQNVLVIDLLCDSRLYSAANVSGDGFHPSDQGHQWMADLAYPALLNGTAAPPAASCAQRMLLPAF
jgi:lysophospholipase L1-like esterase